MNQVIFSQAAVFRLQQLANQVCQHTGVRYKLSDSTGVLSLLNESAHSRKTDVQTCYEAFVMELNKRQIDALLAQGVSVRPPPQSLLSVGREYR
jgi:hypothetical protein